MHLHTRYHFTLSGNSCQAQSFQIKSPTTLDKGCCYCGCNRYPVTHCSLIEELMKGEVNFLLAEFCAAAEEWYAIHT